MTTELRSGYLANPVDVVSNGNIAYFAGGDSGHIVRVFANGFEDFGAVEYDVGNYVRAVDYAQGSLWAVVDDEVKKYNDSVVEQASDGTSGRWVCATTSYIVYALRNQQVVFADSSFTELASYAPPFKVGLCVAKDASSFYLFEDNGNDFAYLTVRQLGDTYRTTATVFRHSRVNEAKRGYVTGDVLTVLDGRGRVLKYDVSDAESPSYTSLASYSGPTWVYVDKDGAEQVTLRGADPRGVLIGVGLTDLNVTVLTGGRITVELPPPVDRATFNLWSDPFIESFSDFEYISGPTAGIVQLSQDTTPLSPFGVELRGGRGTTISRDPSGPFEPGQVKALPPGIDLEGETVEFSYYHVGNTTGAGTSYAQIVFYAVPSGTYGSGLATFTTLATHTQDVVQSVAGSWSLNTYTATIPAGAHGVMCRVLSDSGLQSVAVQELSIFISRGFGAVSPMPTYGSATTERKFDGLFCSKHKSTVVRGNADWLLGQDSGDRSVEPGSTLQSEARWYNTYANVTGLLAPVSRTNSVVPVVSSDRTTGWGRYEVIGLAYIRNREGTVTFPFARSLDAVGATQITADLDYTLVPDAVVSGELYVNGGDRANITYPSGMFIYRYVLDADNSLVQLYFNGTLAAQLPTAPLDFSTSPDHFRGENFLITSDPPKAQTHIACCQWTLPTGEALPTSYRRQVYDWLNTYYGVGLDTSTWE